MITRLGALALLLAGVTVVSGCAGTGGSSSQTQTTIYDMHRRVVKLDKSLDDSIGKLNETTAELIARVSESDQQARRLRTVVEENQVKLDNLARELAELKVTVYRQWNLTLPPTSAYPAMSGPEGDGIEVVIERPAGAAATAPPPVTSIPPPAPATAATPAPATPAPAGDPQVAYLQAQKSFSNDDFAFALQQFDDFLRNYPASDLTPSAQFWKGRCLQRLERYQDAINEFDVLRASYPTDQKVPFAIQNQAICYANLGQISRAEALMEEVIEKYPLSVAAKQAETTLRKLREN